jgi:hypothetical protein
MHLAHDLWRLTQSLSLALAGGRAPASWQRALVQSRARIDAVRRACAWLEVFAAGHPGIRQAPLWGNSLTELAAEGVRPDSAGHDVSHPVRQRFTEWARPPVREHQPASDTERPTRRSEATLTTDRAAAHSRRAPLLVEPGAAHPDPVLAGLPRQASGALLHRLVGQSAASFQTALLGRSPLALRHPGQRHRSFAGPQAQEERNARWPWPLDFNERRGGQPDAARQRQRDRRLGLTHAPGAQHAWQADVVRRAMQALYRDYPDAAATTKQGETALAQPWLVAIAGSTAPPELLAWLAGLSQQHGIPSSNAERDMVSSRTVPAGRPQHTRIAGGSNHELMAPMPSWSKHRELLTPVAEAGDDGVPEEAAMANRPGERLVPMAVLPPLLSPVPPQGERLLMPSPVTAAPQPPGLEEAAGAEDDLSELAAKIKHILDEEARRHGIDV